MADPLPDPVGGGSEGCGRGARSRPVCAVAFWAPRQCRSVSRNAVPLLVARISPQNATELAGRQTTADKSAVLLGAREELSPEQLGQATTAVINRQFFICLFGEGARDRSPCQLGRTVVVGAYLPRLV